jgi:PIN domain nuclease of toxin-antitoxin system
MNAILLDTHAAVWSVLGELKAQAIRAIDEAAQRGELLLSPISAWEVGTLVRKGRLSLAMTLHEYIRALYSRPGVVTAQLTPQIAVASTTLPGTFHDDPADRMLIATAAAYGARLMTRDKTIHAFARATKHIRCIPC